MSDPHAVDDRTSSLVKKGIVAARQFDPGGLQEKYPDVKMWISEKSDELALDQMVVPKEQRNQGVGSAVMRDLISYADAGGKRIMLTPSGDWGGSVPRLKRFYKSFGFKENVGSRRDFSTRHTMIRPGGSL